MSPITVLAVDDNIVVRAGLVALLETADDIRVVGEAGDGAEAVVKARELRPDVVLLDVRMPVRDGVSVVEELAEHEAEHRAEIERLIADGSA